MEWYEMVWYRQRNLNVLVVSAKRRMMIEVDSIEFDDRVMIRDEYLFPRWLQRASST